MKKIMVTQSSMPDLDEFVDEIKDIWESKWLTNMGVKHKTLQAGLEKFLGVEHIDLFTNGHMAIELSLQALNLPRGGEVITTPFTFASTTHAIVRNGLKPVFCDINPVDFTMDVSKIEKLITPKTCAILPVHVYGNVCDVEAIDAIAKKHNLKVVYDAAHAFGVRYKDRGVGNFGDASCFSFHATKVFNTIEGGAVAFKDLGFGNRIYKLKNFGILGPEDVDGVGANAKMNEFCAAMGLCNLRHIDRELEKRERVCKVYRQHLQGLEGLSLNPIQQNVKPNYAYFPIVVDGQKFGKDRNQIMQELADKNIFSRKYFYPLTSDFKCYEGIFDSGKTPVAKQVANQVLTLPLYADLSLQDVETICNIIKSKKPTKQNDLIV